MIQGVHKFRTDIRRTKREQHKADQRIFDMQINRICRLILFVKYLFTFRMQEAKAALDLDKELSQEDFNDSLNKLFGTIAFPELNKGECVEMELICELKVKTEKCE